MGMSAATHKILETKRVRHERGLRAHPNFELSAPVVGESQIAYALRLAAHLLSPPKVVGEDESVECDDAAAAVRALKDDLERLWGAPYTCRVCRDVASRRVTP